MNHVLLGASVMLPAMLLAMPQAGAAPATILATPSDVVAKAPAAAWISINADDLLVIDLANGGRIIVQLAPAFAPVHVANIKALARSGYWNGSSVYRLQDDYVAQWGLNESNKPWPAGVNPKPPAEYQRSLKGLMVNKLGSPDPYAPNAGFANGWPIGYSIRAGWATLAHCYGSVGVGRDLSPDTGSGGELYAVIGQAPRQLDRNIALVGRVVEGIDRLSSLPRGTGEMGFYKERSQDVPIAGIHLASDIPVATRPVYQMMDTNSPSFSQYLHLRANRHDAFYDRPAGGVDLCNVPVPVRRRA